MIPAKLRKIPLVLLVHTDTFQAIMETLDLSVDKTFVMKLRRTLCCPCSSVQITISNCSISYLIQSLQNSVQFYLLQIVCSRKNVCLSQQEEPAFMQC